LQHAQRLVPIDGLQYQHPAAEISLALGQAAPHHARYQLNLAGEPQGTLSFQREGRFTESELAQLESALSSLIYPLRNALLYQAALYSALRDALTGAGSRVAMDQALEREILLAQRSLQPMAVLMLDIDHFKATNDSYRHSVHDLELPAAAGETNTPQHAID